MTDRLDQRVLQELRVLMEEDFDALLQAFLEDSTRQLQEVSDACESGQLERLRRGAHSLKGASTSLGATKLASLCADLELLALEGRSEAIPRALERMRAELRDVRDAVAAIQHNQ